MIVNKFNLFLLMFFFIMLGNLVAAIGIFFSDTLSSILLPIKELTLILSIFFSFFCFRSQKLSTLIGVLMFLAVLIIILLFSIFSSASLGAILASIRQLVVFWLIFLFSCLFFSSVDDEVKRGQLSISMLKIGYFIVLVGFIERFTHAWHFFIRPYFLAKNIGVFENGYPFVMVEPLPLFSEFSDTSGFLRMSSTLLDPINFGHTCVAFYALAVFLHKFTGKGYFYTKFIFFIATLLSFSKGAIMQLLIVLFFGMRWLPIYIKMFISLLICLLSLFYISGHAGFLLHLNGLEHSFDSLSLFGNGVGSAGNVAAMYNTGFQLNLGVSDTFIGSVLAQVGIIGLVLWLLPFVFISLAIYENAMIFVVVLWSQLVLSVLSENSFNFMSIFNVSVFIGMAFSNEIRNINLNGRKLSDV